MSFAVAITNTDDRFSESRQSSKTRAVVPESEVPTSVPDMAFSIVDPEDHGGDRFSHLDRPAHVLLRRSHQAPEHPADIQPQERHLPEARDRLGAEALSASLNAQQEDPLAEAGRNPRLVRECQGARKPFLQVGEAADVAELRFRLVVIQKAALRMIWRFPKTWETSCSQSRPSFTRILAKTFPPPKASAPGRPSGAVRAPPAGRRS